MHRVAREVDLIIYQYRQVFVHGGTSSASQNALYKSDHIVRTIHTNPYPSRPGFRRVS